MSLEQKNQKITYGAEYGLKAENDAKNKRRREDVNR